MLLLNCCDVRLFCNAMDCSPSGSSVCGIFQTRTLEWVTISYSKGSSPPRDWTLVSSIAGGFFSIKSAFLWWLKKVGKESSCSAEHTGDKGSILRSGNPLEKEMATHASIVAWKILCTEEPGELQSMGSQRVEQNWATNTSLPLSHQESPYIQVYRIIIND